MPDPTTLAILASLLFFYVRRKLAVKSLTLQRWGNTPFWITLAWCLAWAKFYGPWLELEAVNAMLRHPSIYCHIRVSETDDRCDIDAWQQSAEYQRLLRAQKVYRQNLNQIGPIVLLFPTFAIFTGWLLVLRKRERTVVASSEF